MSTPGAPTAQPDPVRLRRTLRGVRRGIAALASLALGAGLAVVGVAAPASAHTGDLKATAVCNEQTGQYDVTYTLKLSQSGTLTGQTMWRVGGTRFDGTPTSSSGMDRGPIASTGDTTLTLGTESLPGDTVGNGPWVYAFTTWSDRYVKGSDGRIEGLKGNCQKPFDWNWDYAAPTCDALKVVYPANIPAGQANDVNVRIVADGRTVTLNFHNDDGTWSGTKIFTFASHPAWPSPNEWTVEWVQVGGTNYHWSGSVSCGEPEEIAIPAQPEKVDVCGVADDRILEPAASEGVTWTISPVVNGAATAKATAKPGYVFTDGTAIQSWDFEFTNDPCDIVLDTPVAPEVVDQCGVDGDLIVEPRPTTGVRWEISAIVGGQATAVAHAERGYTFAEGATEIAFPLSFDTEPCPPTEIALVAAPRALDLCGTDDDRVELTEQPHVTWSQTGSPASGTVTVTAIAEAGFVFDADGEFPGGAERSFELHFETEACPTELPAPVAPAVTDRCGVDGDGVIEPKSTTGVRWEISEIVEGRATATAHAEPGFTFADGVTEIAFPLAFDTTACEQPTLAGSTAAAVCEANTPWIEFDVLLTDPDGISTGHTATLVLSDGTHTERVELGALGEDGRVDGRVLWPGAAVDAEGTPTAWPGWAQLPDGRWVVTEDNFGWTHSLTSAVIEVNPEQAITLAYPPAVAGCGPKAAQSPATPVAAGNGNGLASTGFAGGTVALLAGGLVLAGGAVLLVIFMVRRRRS